MECPPPFKTQPDSTEAPPGTPGPSSHPPHGGKQSSLGKGRVHTHQAGTDLKGAGAQCIHLSGVPVHPDTPSSQQRCGCHHWATVRSHPQQEQRTATPKTLSQALAALGFNSAIRLRQITNSGQLCALSMYTERRHY